MVLTSKVSGRDPNPLDEGHQCDHRKGFEWCRTLLHVDSTTCFPLGSWSNDAIILTVAVSLLGGVDGKIPIRDESINMPTPIDW